MDRSFFFKSMAALGASGLFLPGLAEIKNVSFKETGWDDLREQFSLPDNYRYFNTAGIGAVPIKVREEVNEFWNDTEVHPRPGHNVKKWTEVKHSLSDVLGINDPNSVALTNSATEGINILLNGFPFNANDEVITTTHEHPALHVPLINISKRKGVRIKTFEPDLDNGLNNLSRIDQLITRRTKLIFISLVTCTTGQLFPVEEIIELAHKKGIYVALDGAQASGQIPVRLNEWEADFYTSGGQKWLLGPKRTGFLFIQPNLIDLIEPTTVGAYSEVGYSVHSNDLQWAGGCTRFEYATQNESLFHGLQCSLNFMTALGIDAIQQHNQKLSELLVRELSEIPKYQLFSPTESAYRTAIISFGHSQISYKDLASQLMKRSFRVRVVFEGGVEAVRVALHVYNSEDEVYELIDCLRELA